MTVPAPDPRAALELLEQLWPDPPAGWVSLFAIERATCRQVVRWHPLDRLDDLAATATDLAATADVWFGVGARGVRLERGRGGDSDVS